MFTPFGRAVQAAKPGIVACAHFAKIIPIQSDPRINHGQRGRFSFAWVSVCV